MEKLREQVFEVESTIGGIGDTIETLNDAEFMLGQLVIKMNETMYKDELKYFIGQYHREVRVLSELIRYSIKDLNDNFKKTQDIQRGIFQRVMREEIIIKNPTHSNELVKK